MLNDNFVTFEIGKAKHIALVAHDGKSIVPYCRSLRYPYS